MKLRDFYPSLDALCEDMNVEKEVIVRTLKEWDLSIILSETDSGNCRKLINRWVGAVSCKDAEMCIRDRCVVVLEKHLGNVHP